ncbi:Dyp-type peroxidase [Dichomitus squalens LYAD-421 SS1]|uniref:Dyp-type peroxidase n=1 Tax=Dichomitus squalens (strain LYAD-421) TaxID=732165 RepID=R7SKV9_DICSQ|nr:Dyp-type peroxidase [Dichomitus squalens LYAD-421 SS1]EJF56508.1 Dyp-type peroxidase [Dichomitus squalens LYAD-421 SS1]
MSATLTPLNPANVQGDILVGLPKKVQHYLFFQIDNDVTSFRKRLGLLIPLITTTAQVQDDRAKIAANKEAAAKEGKAPELLKLSGVNIAFSQFGLTKLGITDNVGDTAFVEGQLKDSQNLGDAGTTDAQGNFTPDWLPAFKNQIHGLIIISGDSELTVSATQATVMAIFNIGVHITLHEITTLKGVVRPGAEKGHEHFGFLDGISQPAVKEFDTKPNPGQETVRQGVILCGRENDVDANNNNTPFVRPPWALDGSFLALRYLFQLVPEFNTFLTQSADPTTGLSSDLLGARLVGRWKSGAPVDVFPLQDNPEAGTDPSQNNNFRYDFPDDQQTQDRCPFAAHTRKTNPRADLEDLNISTESRRIIRRGVQFGPELTPAEISSGKTIEQRGLIFAAYSGSITNGFQFVQHSWADNTGFPIKKPVTPGFDAIIGQNGNGPRSLSGANPKNQSATLALPANWVVPKGGEYFFSPSIPALRSTFALA